MQRTLFFATLAVIAAPAIAADATAADPAGQAAPISDPQQRDAAIREIQDLKARINRLETALGVPTTPPPIQYTPAAPRGPKDHNLELYGFLQLDAIQDFNRVNPDWDATLRPSRIPTLKGQFGGDGQSIFSVRQSRLGAKATGSLAGKPYEAKFEFDLFGTGVDAGQTTFRVRHMEFVGLEPQAGVDFSARRTGKAVRSRLLQRILKRPPNVIRDRLGGELYRQRIRQLQNEHEHENGLAAGVLSLRKRLLQWNSIPRSPERLPLALQREISDEFRGEIERLGRLLDRDLSHWLQPRESTGTHRDAPSVEHSYRKAFSQ